MKSLLLLIAFSFSFVGCNSQSVDPPEEEEPACVFTNPIVKGADPWIIQKDDLYYAVESADGGIQVFRSEHLTEVLKSRHRSEVWRQPAIGWNQQNLWAPELHYVHGEWFIYYTAGESGPPFISQRSGVLRAETDDPLGDYEDMGMLYTGDNIETEENVKWAIDLTVLEHEGNLYGIWSGWEENASTDRTPQHLYIAEMENPWTISSNRVQISSPEEPWETGSELAINEGAEVLKNGDQTFVIYSASESWLPAYNLGQLELVGNDPMDPASWEKSGSVFGGSGQVFGTGHASFTQSPDSSENWIAYHTKVDEEPGWNRVVHLQPFSWNEDGSPDFGTPVQPGKELQRPSGECETE
jgi:GH43 family beta-xylosidase